MDVWVEGSDRGEADQRLAPMTIIRMGTPHVKILVCTTRSTGLSSIPCRTHKNSNLLQSFTYHLENGQGYITCNKSSKNDIHGTKHASMQDDPYVDELRKYE